jgi:hypothetical protein
MLLMHPRLARPPWDGGAPRRPGEEDPIRIARTLGQWWRIAAGAEQAMAPAVVVGIDGDNSLTRWAQAPQAGASTLLLLPDGAFSGVAEGYRDRLAEAWDGGTVTSTLPESIDADLVLLVSGEPPGLFAERLRRLAQDPKLQGKALAAWGLLAPIRRDLPAALLAEGNLSALGLAPPTVLGMRTAVGQLAAMRAHLRGDSDARQRLELLPGPFLWFF